MNNVSLDEISRFRQFFSTFEKIDPREFSFIYLLFNFLKLYLFESWTE